MPGLVIASNKRLSKALPSGEWENIRGAFRCWSGTLTCNVGSNDTFKEVAKRIASYGNSYYVTFMDLQTDVRYLFPVPDEHLDKANAILVAEHPDFTLVKEGRDRIVQATTIDVVEGFPKTNDLVYGDPKYDIPHGKRSVTENRDSRYLWRIHARVGLIARDHGYRNVYLDRLGAFGVVVEAADANALRAS